MNELFIQRLQNRTNIKRMIHLSTKQVFVMGFKTRQHLIPNPDLSCILYCSAGRRNFPVTIEWHPSTWPCTACYDDK